MCMSLNVLFSSSMDGVMEMPDLGSKLTITLAKILSQPNVISYQVRHRVIKTSLGN